MKKMWERFKYSDKVELLIKIAIGLLLSTLLALVVYLVAALIIDNNNYNNSEVTGYMTLTVSEKYTHSELRQVPVTTTTTTMVNGQARVGTTVTYMPRYVTVYTTILTSDTDKKYISETELLFNAVSKDDTVEIAIRQTPNGNHTFYSYNDSRVDLENMNEDGGYNEAN